MASVKSNELPVAGELAEIVGHDTVGRTSRKSTSEAVSLEFSRLNVGTFVEQCDASATQSQASAVEAGLRASASRNTLLSDGTFSALHYSEEAKDVARAAPFLEEVEIDGTVSSPMTLSAALHKSKTLVFTRSTALTVKCPVGFHTEPAIGGGPSQAWVNALHLGSGLITFTEDTTLVVEQPSLIGQAAFNYAVDPAVAGVTRTHNFTVGAGVNRRVVCTLLAIHASSKVGRNSTLTFASSTSLTKTVNDTSTASWSGTNPIVVAQWTCSVADSTTSTVHTISVTPDTDPLSYVLVCLAYSKGDEFISPVGTSNATNATVAGINVTSVEDKSIQIGIMAHRGHDALPLTVDPEGGTVLYNQKTPSNRANKDISYAVVVRPAPTADIGNFTSTSAKNDKTAVASIVLQPNSSATVGSTLLAPDGATLSAAGKMCTLIARSNGTQWIKQG